MKIVFDTNVYLAAIKKDGYAQQQLKRAQPDGPYRLYVSPDIVVEVQRKLKEKFQWSQAESAHYVETILMYATMVYPREQVTDVLQDVDDHIILECAFEVRAEVIVTADRGLLQLKEFRGTKIVHPTMLQYLL